jgi:hypothetical protein
MIEEGEHERGKGAPFSDFLYVPHKMEQERGRGAHLSEFLQVSYKMFLLLTQQTTASMV